MSRRSQITRTADAAGIAEPVDTGVMFSWNASVTSSSYMDFAQGEQGPIGDIFPFHTSLGVDVDFVAMPEPVPHLRIVVPRDGIYSVSARVHVTQHGFSEEFNFEPYFQLNVLTDSPFGYFVDQDMRKLVVYDTAPASGGLLHASNAGWPFLQGNVIWAEGADLSDGAGDLGFATAASLVHLSVTYEAELGQVFSGGGG